MKTIAIIPLLALLAVTGCGNHATDNQSSTNNIPASPAPLIAGDTNIAILPKTTENPLPSTTPEMTTPGSSAITNAPADTNSPSITNQPPGS